MEKLKALLQKAGASSELSGEIVGAFDSYKAQLKNDADRLFEQRLQKAKQVCAQIVEEEKERLSRKVSIFLESKARKIEEAAERHRKIEESEASAMLRQVESLVTGRDLNDGAGTDDRKLQAAKTTITRLQEQLTRINEERELAIAKANRANKIAEKALSRNHSLETQLREGDGELPDFIKKKKEEGKAKKDDKSDDSDDSSSDDDDKDDSSDDDKGGNPFAESKKPRRKKGKKRLDEGRKTSRKPRSTRPTLVESQVKKNTKKSGGDPRIVELSKRVPEMPI